MNSNRQEFDMSIPSKLRDGKEQFHGIGDAPSFTLAEFWQWSASDFLNNALRGVLVEFVVAKALGIQIAECRTEWDCYDMLLMEHPWRNRTEEEGIRVEVKSSAYLQSWIQAERHSHIGFDIAL